MGSTTADLLIERLVDWGVDTVFGFPGDGINGILEALRTHQDAITRSRSAPPFPRCGSRPMCGAPLRTC